MFGSSSFSTRPRAHLSLASVVKGSGMIQNASSLTGSSERSFGLYDDIEAAPKADTTNPTGSGEQDSPGPILSDILSCLPLQIIQALHKVSSIYGRWIRRIIIARIVFSAFTNPSQISGGISGLLGLCFAFLWLGEREWRRRTADTILSTFVIIAAYIKSDPVTFQLLLGDFYRTRETDARQVTRTTSTPYRAPLAYCLEPYTSPLAFCYDPLIFIPGMLMVYRKLTTYFTCPGLEGRVIDTMSILTALFTIWVLFPEFSWTYTLSGRPWTLQDLGQTDSLARV
ncbi:hypothetical protein TWF730_009120 [Orbilia blumenaviensis]|uniref:Uncharacterized protein n=1 Tax=Orbilia blumenaviensis TaxID=1796055 RepID=A0AAV9UYA7_9PEZI